MSVCALALFAVLAAEPSAEPSAEERAVSFLAREVPKWPLENKCFSCHNNGDAARALFAARAAGLSLKGETLRATTAWLARPTEWENNGGKGEFSDKRLANVQFSAALWGAIESGALSTKDRETAGALAAAARLVAAEQGPDGAWNIDAEGTLGSPVTYGAVLATVTSLRVLRGADRAIHAEPIAKGEAWLARQKPRIAPDAAALLLGLAESGRGEHEPHIEACLELIASRQDKSGGWGPYATSPAEPFDTALALLALVRFRERPGATEQIARGRAHLLETQLKDGSWIETTRPPGAESYAQRLSTTGWATLALLATRPKDPAAK